MAQNIQAKEIRLLAWTLLFFFMVSPINCRSKNQRLNSVNDETTNSVSSVRNQDLAFPDKIKGESGLPSLGLISSESPRAKADHISRKSEQQNEKAGRRKHRKRGRKNRKRNTANLGVKPDDILRETMIHMFGFKHMPARQNCGDRDCSQQSSEGRSHSRESIAPLGGNPMSSGTGFKPNPPSFMLELYRSYTEDKDLMMSHSKSQGNTVRSFYPSPANPQHREENFGQAIVIAPVPQTGIEFIPTSVFLFNITLIPTLEDLVAAEIRLDGPFMESETEVVVGVYKQQTNCEDGLDCEGNPAKVFTKVGKTLLLDSISASTWSDSKLAKLAERARQSNHVVVVKFASDPNDMDDVLSRLRRHYDLPRKKRPLDLPDSFVSYDVSRSKRSNRENGRAENLENERLSRFLASAVPMFIAYCNDPRTMDEAETAPAAPVIWKALENITSSIRVRRSPESNSHRLPANPEPETEADVDTHIEKPVGDVSSRNSIYVVERRKPGNKRRKKKNRSNQVSRNSTQISPNSRQVARPSKRKKNRGKGSKKKGSKKEKINIQPHPSITVGKKSCNRRSLVVSFADIGWSEWIISPENFEAYYCSGTCDLAQGSSTTNHAIIQAVVKNIAGHSHLPSPCCVPDKLLPLSVLFFDEDKNVVLKVFPNMSVETCACR